jgi:hypothetical protein
LRTLEPSIVRIHPHSDNRDGSYQQFRALIIDWNGIAEGAYQNSRRLA